MSDEYVGSVLRQSRERAMNDLATVIEAIYGPRCLRREAGCVACVAWLQFDVMDHLTEGTLVDLADQYNAPRKEKTE